MQKILETARGQGQFFVFNVVRSVVLYPMGLFELSRTLGIAGSTPIKYRSLLLEILLPV